MNYFQIYDDMIKSCKKRGLNKRQFEFYLERHHIIPKCMGGTDKKDNIVLLQAREHFIAHLLLSKMYPHEKKLLIAIHRMMHDKQGDKLSGRSYEFVKKQYSHYRKSQNKENSKSVAIQSEKMKGRNKENDPGMKAMSEKLTGRTKENDPGMKAMSEKLTGRTKETHEGIARTAEKLTGRTKENFASVATMAKKMKGRNKENDPGMKAMSEKLTGRTKETHEYIELANQKRQILPKFLYPIIRNLYLIGKGPKKIHQWVSSLGFSISYSGIRNISYKSNPY